ncbi:MAG: glycosyltransferase family 39 protein [Bacteroidales bacterium]|nr:glycosyltransferase family 39 protein [Bacteroidales bacterium]
MNRFLRYIGKENSFFHIVALVLFFPAFLINLGLLPLNFPTDEPRRALVALEMILSENYLTPTLNGEFYYNKPPLYNWIIILSYRLAGNYSEFAVRIPVIVSTLIFGLIVFLYHKRHFGRDMAFLHALMLATCGRLLFYDSFLGLIDITYSWLVYLNFMLIYHGFLKQRFLSLFLLSYLITAAGFLMKGLPSLVFQGFTLLAVFIMHRRFRMLFTWQHAAGIMTFLVITGCYYFFYFRANPDSSETVFSTLFNETTRRTVVRFGVWATLLHIFTFPVGLIYHFAPWTLMLVPLFFRKTRRRIMSDPFIRYSLIILVLNILVYWTSPETRPRYLFMFVPLMFTIITAAYSGSDHPPVIRRMTEWVFGIMLITGIAALLVMPFIHLEIPVNGAFLKSLLLALPMLLLVWLYYRIPGRRLILFGIGLLLVRVGFNWFIIPQRLTGLEPYKTGAVEASRISRGEPLHVYRYTPIQDAATFYITRERQEILKRKHDGFQPGELCIIHPSRKDVGEYELLHEFLLEWEHTTLYLVRLK